MSGISVFFAIGVCHPWTQFLGNRKCTDCPIRKAWDRQHVGESLPPASLLVGWVGHCVGMGRVGVATSESLLGGQGHR